MFASGELLVEIRAVDRKALTSWILLQLSNKHMKDKSEAGSPILSTFCLQAMLGSARRWVERSPRKKTVHN